MKRGIYTLAISTILALSFISAYYGGSFSISDFFDSIEPSTIILGALFLIFFAVLNFALGKFFKDKEGQPNKPITSVVALAVSLLIIYSIYRTGFDYEGTVYSIGIPQATIWAILPWVIIAGVIFLFWKLKSNALLALGIILILLTTFGDFVYNKGGITTIGIILIVLWLALKVFEGWKEFNRYGKKKKKHN